MTRFADDGARKKAWAALVPMPIRATAKAASEIDGPLLEEPGDFRPVAGRCQPAC